jgi:cysteine desulfurase
MHEIYLDNAATTRPLGSIRGLLDDYLENGWHNPSALYAPAVLDAKKMEQARETLKKGFGAGLFEVLFTSSGTEGDAAVILGGAKKQKAMHYITSEVEHAAVYQAMLRLREAGHDVTFIKPDRYGRVDPDAVAGAVRDDTVLVSIMHVNNQTGAISDISRIARSVKAKNPNTLFHSDGVQAFLRVGMQDVSCIDYYTVSAHKIHGLKGVGAVFYKKGMPLKALIPGGGQEKNLRSGTENTFGIEAFAHAAGYFLERKKEIENHLSELKKVFLAGIGALTDVEVLTPPDGADHIVCLMIKDVRGEVLLHTLEDKQIYISTGAACTSKKGVSRAALGLGLSRAQADGIVRVSFCPFNTADEADSAAKGMAEAAQALRIFTRR